MSNWVITPKRPGFYEVDDPSLPSCILEVRDTEGGLSVWVPTWFFAGDPERKGSTLVSVLHPCLDQAAWQLIEVPDALPEEVK